ncbi:MAG: 1-acyl-sn-glycerol-3-phosphate acyltransferase, partial [Acidobacteria bacterium]|nr:1-acyl-sn-glycerol-3-phosphate acyltransferase [Acidobacteriota bacterium]
ASGTDKPAGERLYAVVVPDMDLMRQKKIVNAGDVLRFEFEGLGATLPSYKRVLGYEVSFEPLPRTTTGKLKRHEVEKRLARAAEVAAGQTPASDEAPVWPDDAHVTSVLAIVRRRVGDKAVLAPGANLELDLGLDSMERVELQTELEQATGRRIPEEESQQIYTLGELVDAVRPTGTDVSVVAGRASTDMSWSVLLKDLPPPSDPVLGRLLESRPLVEPLLFLLSRVFRALVVRTSITGVDKLPAAGAYLICPNHQSYVDSFCLYSVLPYRTLARLFFVGAVEYFETPLMAYVARKINCVPVDSDSNLVPAMKAGAFGLAHGKILVLFPEGERSIDGTVKRFKKGAPILSRHLNAPIVPVAIRGAHETWPRGQSFNWRALVPFGGVHVRITIGEPFSVRADETDGEAAERLRGEVQGMWERS